MSISANNKLKEYESNAQKKIKKDSNGDFEEEAESVEAQTFWWKWK
jgi:hypothetical protein